jgi:cysteine synthase/rhodanese-related sulfurtransferase
MADHTLRRYEDILEMLSTPDNPTPLLRLHRVVPFQHTKVYAKLEWYNPWGAVKCRVGANLIVDAEARGVALEHLVEPTSGNTGMGLAMVANAKGYKFTATLSTAIPAEKRAILRLFGAEVVELEDELCPAPGAPEGAIAKAAEMGKRPGWTQLDQYRNPANPAAHYKTTGPEIWRQTEGRVTHFVAGLGTCGTITGTGRFLKEQNKAIQVLGVHPAEGHDIPGVRSLRQLKQTALFVPDEYDGLVEIDNERAFKLCKRLNQEESVIAGPSSAMALAGAFAKVPDAPGNVCVVIFPDNAFKYASSFKKHLPELFPADKSSSAGAPNAEHLNAAFMFAQTSRDVVDGEAVAALAKAGATLVDVRTAKEFATSHLPGAINLPLADLANGSITGLPTDHAHPLVAVCQRGQRSLYGMLILKALGYEKVKSLYGGLNAWVEEGRAVDSSG